MTRTAPTDPRLFDAEFGRIVDELTRRGFLGGAAGAAALLGLSACGTSAPDPAGDPAAWSFTDDLGRNVTAARRPRRIVTLSGVMTYSLCSAGLAPVGAPILSDSAPTLRGLGMSKDAIDAIVKVNASADDNTINLEAVAKARPDLIVDDVQGGKAFELTQTPKLAAIAPVAALDIQDVTLDRGMASVHRLVTSLGVPLTDARAEARYQRVAAQLRAALADKPGLRVAFGWGNTDQFQVNAEPQWNYMKTLAGLGMTFTPVTTSKSNVWAQQFSWETVSGIDADLIVLTYYGVPKNPAWPTMPAVEAGQYVDMSDQWVVSSYTSYAGYLQTLLKAVRSARVLS